MPVRVDIGYDNRNERTSLTRYSDVAGAAVVGTTICAFDNADRVTSEIWQSKSTTGSLLSGTQTYAYDATSQLTADGATPYSYDANGNRTMAGYQTGTNNRISTDGTWTYTYDAAGDIVKKSKGAGLEAWYYGYDTLNRLTSIEQTSNGTALLLTATTTYDVYGKRAQEDDWTSGGGATTTRTDFDGSQAWADTTSGNIATVRYVWGRGGQDLYARIDVGTGLRQVSQDRLGSVRDVWDGTGVLDHVQYAAFGAITSETAAAAGGRFLFTTLPQNRATGTVDAFWRTEFVDIGRWAQPDPIAFSAGDGNLQRYVGNNPTNMTDPSGLASIDNRDRIATAYTQAMTDTNRYAAAYGHGAAYTQDQIDAAGAGARSKLGVDEGPDGWRNVKDFGSALWTLNPIGQAQWAWHLWSLQAEQTRLDAALHLSPSPNVFSVAGGAAWEGVGDGTAMFFNAATFHKISSLDNHVNQIIDENGGLYETANFSMHVGAYALEAAVLLEGLSVTGIWTIGETVIGGSTAVGGGSLLGGGVVVLEEEGEQLGPQAQQGFANTLTTNPPVGPPPQGPYPPGWNPTWQWRDPSGEAEGTWRWWDPNGGEWRFHDTDPWHNIPHWDWNPWDAWCSDWDNVYMVPPPQAP